MSLRYKILKRAKPGKRSSEGMVYYPYPQRPGSYDLDEIARLISHRSTMSEADVVGVLYALVEAVTDKVSEGSIVELGRLGTFKLTLKSNYQDSPEDVNANCITGNRLVFNPSMHIKRKLKNLSYKKGK